jgi:mycoredoxin-dependent peroxiredoxin
MIEVGQPAPDFTLANQHGESVTLSGYRGSKNVVLVFYPWAFTGVCTGELCELRDRIDSFDNDDTVTLAVSCDSRFSLRVFAEQEKYTFQLLADFWPHGEVAKAYGVFVEKVGAARRGTFIIDRAGVVRWTVLHEIADARDTDEYEQVLAGLVRPVAGGGRYDDDAPGA